MRGECYERAKPIAFLPVLDGCGLHLRLRSDASLRLMNLISAGVRPAVGGNASHS